MGCGFTIHQCVVYVEEIESLSRFLLEEIPSRVSVCTGVPFRLVSIMLYTLLYLAGLNLDPFILFTHTHASIKQRRDRECPIAKSSIVLSCVKDLHCRSGTRDHGAGLWRSKLLIFLLWVFTRLRISSARHKQMYSLRRSEALTWKTTRGDGNVQASTLPISGLTQHLICPL